MKRRRIILLVGCLVVVGAILVVAMWPREREPEYGGKKLSEWLMIAAKSNTSVADAREAADAIRHIGTNATPWLLEWIRYEQPRWKSNLRVCYRNLPKPFFNKSIDLWFIGSERLAGEAALGFSILGAEGASAVPELIRLTKSTNALLTSLNAETGLSFIGEAGLPAIEAAITNRATRIDLRRYLISSIMNGMDPHRTVPVLMRALEDPDLPVREEATNALRLIAPEVFERGEGQTNGNFRQEN